MKLTITLRSADSLAGSPNQLDGIKRRGQLAGLQGDEPLLERRRIVIASVSGGALVFLLMLSACGNGGDKVASKGAEANAAGNPGQAIAANSPSPTTSEAFTARTADNPMSPGTAQTRNSDRSVSTDPKPQISTGGSDFFLFTQARGVLGTDSELKTANITIDVQAGVLTMSGTVANAAQKSKAEELMRGVGGVREVKNQLRISS